MNPKMLLLLAGGVALFMLSGSSDKGTTAPPTGETVVPPAGSPGHATQTAPGPHPSTTTPGLSDVGTFISEGASAVANGVAGLFH